jgi:hypothetical protein
LTHLATARDVLDVEDMTYYEFGADRFDRHHRPGAGTTSSRIASWAVILAHSDGIFSA